MAGWDSPVLGDDGKKGTRKKILCILDLELSAGTGTGTLM
jgi:hypothetical protein